MEEEDFLPDYESQEEGQQFDDVENAGEVDDVENADEVDTSGDFRPDYETEDAVERIEVEEELRPDGGSYEHHEALDDGESVQNSDAVANLQDMATRPKPNDYVQYGLRDGTQATAKVLSKQPKRSGKNSDWINVKVKGDETLSSVNWHDTVWWKKVEEPELVVFLSAAEEVQQNVLDAKEREMNNLVENEVFHWVKDDGQKAISTKWIITEKETADGQKKTKARLVARGFEESKSDLRTDSPTCSRQALRLVFIVAATMGWELQSLDITAAFLQGNQMNREVYVRPPKNVNEESMLWKLLRCLYGLNDAPRAWYKRVEQEFLSLNAKMSAYDDAMFLWFNSDGSLVLILVTHVDDFIYCGTKEWEKKVIRKICTVFKISCHSQGTFKYTGLSVVQTEEAVMVNQHDYITALKPIELSPQRLLQKDEELTVEERGKTPIVRRLTEANKAVKKLQMTKSGLFFPALGDLKEIKVLVYQDAAHANLPNGASQGGFIIFLIGNGKAAPISRGSKKLTRITKGPLASEASILADAADSGFLVAKMVQEVFGLEKRPAVTCKTDSKSLCDHLNTTKITSDARL